MRPVIVQPISIGAFHDQQINLMILFIKVQGRIFYDRFVESAHIARKTNRNVAAVIAGPYQGDGRAENVACVAEGKGHSWRDGQGAVIAQTDKVAQTGCGILHGVEGLQWRLALPGPLLVDIEGILFLNVAGVSQHGRAEIARRGRGKDVAPEAVFDERGNVARVVDMGMG